MDVSVIIPCYNCEQHISRAIQSVLNQTYPVCEIILVDNCSTDNTRNILLTWKNNFPGKIILLSEDNQGATNARNTGLLQAKGSWIQFLDADDELFPEKIERHIEICSSLEEIKVVIGASYMVYNNYRIERPFETKDLWKGLIYSELGITSANLYNKEEVLKVGGWKVGRSSSQEYDLIFRLLKWNVKIGMCTIPLANIYVQDNSLHKSKDIFRQIEIIDNNVNLRLEIRQFLKDKSALTSEKKDLINKHIFSYIINTSGIFPFITKGIFSDYINNKIYNAHIKPPFLFVLKVYLKLAKKKILNVLK